MTSYEGLVREAKDNKLKSFYYFYGDESYLMDRAIQVLKKTCLGEGPADFNYDIFYHADTSLQQILDVADTLPMFSPQRLIVVKNVQDIKAKDQELLMQFLEKKVPTTCLVFVGKKPDGRKKLFQVLKKEKALISFDPPRYQDLMTWMDSLAKEYNRKLNSEAKNYLYQMVGNSLTYLSLELRKADQYLGEEKGEITKSILEKVVTKHRLESVFDLTKSIGQMDRISSLYYLAHLLDQGENENGILALISRHIRILNLIKEGMKEGLSSNQLASRAGVPPYFVKQYMEQAKIWEFSRLDQIHKALVLTDKALKSSPISAPIWLENFVLKSCDPKSY